MARQPCVKCKVAEKKPGHARWCEECWLRSRPMSVQIEAAQRRLARIPESMRRARVPASEWPPGRRWCAGCCSFPRTQDCTGSRCKACASAAVHATNVKSTYGITGEQYEQLLALQEGRCYVCRKQPRKRRLAVDHDHLTGEVRGLLCADNDRGCNHSMLGILESTGDVLSAARRVVSYLEHPPARVLWGENVPRQPGS